MGSKSSAIIPALGEAFLISAIIAWSLLANDALKAPLERLNSPSLVLISLRDNASFF